MSGWGAAIRRPFTAPLLIAQLYQPPRKVSPLNGSGGIGPIAEIALLPCFLLVGAISHVLVAAHATEDCGYRSLLTLGIGGKHVGAACGIMNSAGNLGGFLAPLLTPWIAARAGWAADYISAVLSPSSV